MDERFEHFNTMEAVKAQSEYCRNHDIPNFAPALDGKCYRCNRDIYRPITHSDGRTTGIPVEQAERMLVTGCPHCNYSFVE